MTLEISFRHQVASNITFLILCLAFIFSIQICQEEVEKIPTPTPQIIQLEPPEAVRQANEIRGQQKPQHLQLVHPQ